jgi:uncharacterized membrane protein YfcA
MADAPAIAFAATGLAVGASTQAATGFGFALVAAPAIGAALDPARAVTLLAVLGFATNAATLLHPGDRAAVRRADTMGLLAWALPGMVAGAAVLRWVAPDALRVASGGLAIVAAAVLLGGRGLALLRRRGPAGASAGVLTTTTGFNGPPLVLYLLAHGASPDQLRATLAACFAATGAVGLLALAAAGTLRLPDSATLVIACAGACALGWVAGRAARGRLPARTLRALATATVALAGGAAIAVGLT